jgi:ABC-2 type transport system ATP-binding protein
VGDLTIDASGLRKSYDQVTALNGLDLQVPRGSIFGFLGKNGAGKTTTIKVLLGMVRATAGSARVFDQPVGDPAASVAVRQRTGFVSEDKDLYDGMTVAEIIDFTAAFYPRWRPELKDKYLRAFGLPLHARVKSLSRGTRTKLALLLAFSRGAELLVLDEPTAGLDPVAAEEVLQAIVSHVAREEMTVFFSSHQLSEVDQVADRIAIVHHGRTVLSGGLDDLRERFRRVQIVFDGDAPVPRFRTPGVLRATRQGRVLMVTVSENADAIAAEARALGAASVAVVAMPLKDLFLETVAED